VSKAVVYVAGNYWLNDRVKNEARRTRGFGIVICNGHDLDVLEPMTR
jgi:hypothetical protein